jgi:Tol biopolymer transport system component
LYRRDLDQLEMTPIRGTGNVGSFALSPDGQWLAFNDFESQALVKIPVDGGPVTTLAPIPGSNTTLGGFTWTPEGWIIYSAGPAGSHRGLQRLSEAGGEFEVLTDPPEGGSHLSPSPMPGGESLLFEIRMPDRNPDIAILHLETGEYEILTWGQQPKYVRGDFLLFRREAALWAAPLAPDWRSLSREPFPVVENVGAGGEDDQDLFAVSADGTLFHLDGGGRQVSRSEFRLAVLDLAGNLDVLPLGPRPIFAPVWSPDGQSVAFGGSDLQIYTHNTVLNTTPRQLTFEGVNRGPLYSPDGTRIAFARAVGGADDFAMFVMDLTDDAAPRRLAMSEEPVNPRPMEWPSDTLMLFAGGARDAADLWLLDLSDPDHPEARPYLTSEATLGSMTVAPDGGHAAYVSNESGQSEVYIRSFPDPGTQTIVSQGGGVDPYWSADGNTMFYMDRGRDQADIRVVAARLTRDPVVSVVALDTLFTIPASVRPGSLHPAGDRWIATPRTAATIVRDEEVPLQRLILVENFQEELRRRAAR